jgi:uncharacterized protein (DUF2062 family)
MAIMKEQTWKRHSNPWSVWTRVLTNPLVYIPVWTRSWRQAVLVGAWFLLNPRLFPPPHNNSSWATRSVLGEQIWTSKPRADLPMALNMLSALFFLVALYSAYARQLWRLLSFGSLALVFKLWFLERMVTYYDEYLARAWWRRLWGS